MGKVWGRRRMLAGTAALAMAAAGRAVAEARRAPRRQILSFGPESSFMRVVTIDRPTTFLLSIPLEAPVEALRIGVANITPEPYSLGGFCCCEGSLWDPAPGSEWVYFSFTGAGEQPRAPARTPQPCVVPGNHPSETGATNVPLIHWSDWMRYRTRASSGRPQMLFRALVPPQRLPMTGSVVPQDGLADVGPGLRPWRAGQWLVPGDFVTQPASPPPHPPGTGLSPLYVLQYRPSVPGIQILIGGDSVLANWHTFARQAGIALSTPALPISTWDVAWGAQPTRTFEPCLDGAIDAARPSVCLIQGWSRAHAAGRDQDPSYEAWVRESAERVIRQGGVPVIMKAMPVHLFGAPAALARWQQADQDLDHLVPGALVFDPAPTIEDPAQPGNWRAEASTDGLHPNVFGNTSLRGPFEAMLQTLL